MDTASLATWFLFGKLVCVATLFGFGEKRRRNKIPVRRPQLMQRLPLILLVALSVGCNSKPETKTEPQLSVDPSIANAGAIVCAHVADGEPILRAIRDNPMDPDDSGWQFLCDSGADEHIEDAQIWSVTQVVEREPSLLAFINSPVGTPITRTDVNSQWKPSQ